MKILLIGEYSNVHATLALGLRQLGHQVTVASNGDFWKDYPRDINLARPRGPLAGLRLWLRIMLCRHKLKGYDIVQLINPMFVELKAQRIMSLYQWLKRHNRHIVLGAFGMDYYWVHTCSNNSPLRYSDFNIGTHQRHDPPAERERKDWIGTDKETLNKLIAREAYRIVAGLYEYWACYHPNFPDKTVFVPYPIVIRNVSEELGMRNEELEIGPLKIFIGISRGRSQYKGTDIMLQAAKDVADKYPGRVELQIAEGLPFDQYTKMMEGSDAILDQLYSYTPSMNPLGAMAKGIICIGGGEPENYEILSETDLRPIINVQPTYNSVFHEIEQLVLHPERIPLLKQQSIEYIRRHHEYVKVAKQWIEAMGA